MASDIESEVVEEDEEVEDEEADHSATRPSSLVVPWKESGSTVVVVVVVLFPSEGAGLASVSLTLIPAAGRPMVVSRTWHVIGGFVAGGVAIVGA